MPHLTFWYEFASTYSYLSAMRIQEAAHKAGVEIIWKPFLLGPIFKELGWDTSPFNIYEKKGAYMWRDMERLAEKMELPDITKPEPFPQHSLLATRIAMIGEDDIWLPEFSMLVFKDQYASGKNISDEGVLLNILNGMKLPGPEIIARAKTDTQIKQKLRERTQEAVSRGIFGAPTFITEDQELFWGNDRLEDALDWATK